MSTQALTEPGGYPSVAAATRRATAMSILPIAGLVVAAVTLAASLPTLLAAGGAGPFAGNVANTIAVVVVLAIALAATRTLMWRAVLGIFFTGFFGITALATLVGKPVISGLGDQSTVAMVVWAPLSEEALKALPVVLILLLARRNPGLRLSAGDTALLGGVIGLGFALYEDALYGRGGPGWFGAPPASVLIPTIQSSSGGGLSMLVGGHFVYTALVSLGIGVGLLYPQRFRWAWLAIPVTAAVVLLEHATVNELARLGDGQSAPGWVQVGVVMTLGGYLSSALLVGGLGVVTYLETRTLRRARRDAALPLRTLNVLLLTPAEIAWRGQRLAAMQQPSDPWPAPPTAHAANSSPILPPPLQLPVIELGERS